MTRHHVDAILDQPPQVAHLAGHIDFAGGGGKHVQHAQGTQPGEDEDAPPRIGLILEAMHPHTVCASSTGVTPRFRARRRWRWRGCWTGGRSGCRWCRRGCWSWSGRGRGRGRGRGAGGGPRGWTRGGRRLSLLSLPFNAAAISVVVGGARPAVRRLRRVVTPLPYLTRRVRAAILFAVAGARDRRLAIQVVVLSVLRTASSPATEPITNHTNHKEPSPTKANRTFQQIKAF
eukprot:COSAG01_NODE_2219_length_8143_cov_100.563083_4_plen_232_part_00